NVIEIIGLETLEQALRDMNITEEYSKAILRFGVEDEVTQRILASYVYGTASNTEIKKIGLFRPLKTEPDFVKFLSGIIIILTYPISNVDTRLFFWIDEMEDMVYYNSKQFKQFSQSIR